MSTQEAYQVALLVVATLEQLRIRYEVCGSLASSLHGVPRSTLDADIVADLTPESARQFAAAIGPDFYCVPDAIVESVRAKRSFNIIHLPTMLKVDIFALKDSAFAHTGFSRRVQTHFPDASGPLIWVSSPEDIVLHKLSWYEAGGRVSERQFIDAVGVLRIAGAKIDRDYLAHWASVLAVPELLQLALAEAGKRT